MLRPATAAEVGFGCRGFRGFRGFMGFRGLGVRAQGLWL